MKKLSCWTICLIVASVAMAGETLTLPPFVNVVTEYRVVGFTTTVTNGSVVTDDANGEKMVGYRAMHHLCRTEVAPNAKAANVAEVLSSTEIDFPADFAGAWILPSNIQVVFLPDATDDMEDWQAYEAANPGSAGTTGPRVSTHFGALRSLNCSRYRNSNPAALGLFLRPAGSGGIGPILWGCSTEVPIACSAPVAVPLSN